MRIFRRYICSHTHIDRHTHWALDGPYNYFIMYRWKFFVCCIKVENLYNMMYAINYRQWNMLVKSCSHTRTPNRNYSRKREREKKHAADIDSFWYFKLHMFINELACDVNISNVWTDASPSLVIIYYIPCECVNEFTTTQCVVFAKRFHLQISAIHAPCDSIHLSFLWCDLRDLHRFSPFSRFDCLYWFLMQLYVRFDFIAKETDREN